MLFSVYRSSNLTEAEQRFKVYIKVIPFFLGRLIASFTHLYTYLSCLLTDYQRLLLQHLRDLHSKAKVSNIKIAKNHRKTLIQKLNSLKLFWDQCKYLNGQIVYSRISRRKKYFLSIKKCIRYLGKKSIFFIFQMQRMIYSTLSPCKEYVITQGL